MKSFKQIFEGIDIKGKLVKIERKLYLNKSYFINYFKYNERMLNDFIQMLNTIKKTNIYKPKEKEVRNAVIWQINVGSGVLTYKAKGGEKKFTSQLTLVTSDKKGYDVENVVIKSELSDNIEDVYIHLLNIDKLEKMINSFFSLKDQWNVFKNILDTYINAGVWSILKSVEFDGKRIKFKTIDEYFKFIDLEKNNDFLFQLNKFKSKSISYLNKLLLTGKNDIKKEIILKMKSFIK